MKKITITLVLLFLLSFFYPLASSHNISALLAFGDSTLDAGNNNFINTILKANHKPYGRDFPGGSPTGRFSNGKLITDFVVSSLGLKSALPAYSDPSLTTEDLTTGVSFASAGSGLDDLTVAMSNVITMEQQLHHFRSYVLRLQKSKGKKEDTYRTVVNALIVISAGSNDMMANFYLTPLRRIEFGSVSGYQRFLLKRLGSFVQQLYNMGGRNFAIAGLPPIGCMPLQITLHAMSPNSDLNSALRRVCVDQQNQDSVAHNEQLQSMIEKMKVSFPGAKFSYIDIYNPLMEMIKFPLKYGFSETTLGCCVTGFFETGPTCSIPYFNCSEPSRFMFWDSIHPSQATYQILANEFMQSVIPQFNN